MSELSCAHMADLIDELALDVLPGDLRAVAFDHLEGCAACRSRLEELSESADQLLFAYRPVDPPPGFEDRVLGRLGADRRRARPRRRSRLVAMVAAAAVVVGVAAGAGVALSRGREGGRGGPHGSGVSAQGAELRTVALISSGGQQIGDVSAYTGASAWFFLRVDHGSGTDTYQCVLDVDGGPSVPIGPMVISDGHGGWGQQVNVDGHHVRSARLVDTAGHTVATATFH
jgi:hypothetical protein